METLEKLVASHPFCKDMKAEHIKILSELATQVHFEAEKMVLREGESADQFYLVFQGKATIEVYSPNRGPIKLQNVIGGDVLGWSCMIAPYQWRFDARTLENTDAVLIDAKKMREVCENNRDFGYEILKRITPILVKRLQMTRMQLLDIYGLRY